MPAGSSFAICRTTKIKSWSSLAKSVGHNLRTSNDDRKHLDASAPEAMQIVAGSENWLADWKQEVEGMWLPNLKQGTQHTLAREFFLGMSPEHFDGKDKKRSIDAWAKANVQWLEERFGKERVKLVCLHLDEQTPHLAAYVVGLKADVNRKGERNKRGNGWTLSDGVLGLGGSKDALSKLQDEYAEAMKRFELRRGIKGSKATHQTTAAWRKQLAQPLDAKIEIPDAIAPTIKDRINIEEYGKRVAKAAGHEVFKQMKGYHQQAKIQSKELGEIRSKLAMLEPLAEMFKRFLEMLLGHTPDLHSVEGIREAQKALNPFMPAPRPEAPKAKIKRPPLAAQPERTAKAKPRHRSGHKGLSL